MSGPSGFLHILPVYLDHILYPNLREEDYLTEVHHINGEGQDAGVVYSEMQVRTGLGMMVFEAAKYSAALSDFLSFMNCISERNH